MFTPALTPTAATSVVVQVVVLVAVLVAVRAVCPVAPHGRLSAAADASEALAAKLLRDPDFIFAIIAGNLLAGCAGRVLQPLPPTGAGVARVALAAGALRAALVSEKGAHRPSAAQALLQLESWAAVGLEVCVVQPGRVRAGRGGRAVAVCVRVEQRVMRDAGETATATPPRGQRRRWRGCGSWGRARAAAPAENS